LIAETPGRTRKRKRHVHNPRVAGPAQRRRYPVVVTVAMLQQRTASGFKHVIEVVLAAAALRA